MKLEALVLNHREMRRKLKAETIGATIDLQIEEENYGEEPDRDAEFWLKPDEAIALGEWLISAGRAALREREPK
ncbi:hypothetical protein FHW02_004297 [Ochrobactrum sp. RH1CCR137]|nr:MULTISPECIES: hypothetical protein [unclassified Ochrobactrum]MBA8846207.1 hypothetical protein [Ochrobactrum sp. RH1CCR137]MBA8858026.1 hypothetical protein [Ochrobactrum sp. RH1CCR134]